MKICTQCGKRKQDRSFAIKKADKSGRSSECKVCHRIMRRAYYVRNRILERKRVIDQKKQLAQWFQELKATEQCFRCGENHPATLDFHHRDPKTKEFAVATMPWSGYSKERILREIMKCDVLCSNCHRIHHASVV